MSERDLFPAPPLYLNAVRNGGDSIRLSWVASPDSDVNAYAIYRRTAAQASFAHIATSSATSYIDSGLVQGRRYYYRVTAIDQADGESAFSNEDSAVPDEPRPCRDCPNIRDEPIPQP
jgi:fibronectin type 3 domain-containing protein